MLEMKKISKVVGGETHIHPTDLVLERGTLNVLLGPTLSGKTSLMRLMAGLDKPASGSIFSTVPTLPAFRFRSARLPWSISSSSTIRR